jgi:hypothetical protein
MYGQPQEWQVRSVSQHKQQQSPAALTPCRRQSFAASMPLSQLYYVFLPMPSINAVRTVKQTDRSELSQLVAVISSFLPRVELANLPATSPC